MKTTKIILGVSVAALGLIACDKKQEPAVQPHEPITIVTEPNKDTPQKDEKKTEKLPTADMLALESLGLKPLEIDVTTLPPLPEADDPSDNIGLDAAYIEWQEKWKDPEGSNPNNRPLIGIPPEMVTRHIIWAYGRPSKIVVGSKISIPDSYQRDRDDDIVWWKGRAYIPITLNCREEDYITQYSSIFVQANPSKKALLDSLTKLHGVVPGNLALQSYTPMPYDLRHMRIAHNGVDISPLFSIRYKDYKEVTRTRDYSKWYWRDVRISDVGMDVLDWLFDGYFHIYPLTKDYPRFTIIFILEDGTILSREVEHRI